MGVTEERVDFGSPRLEGVLTWPASGTDKGVVLSHPHSKLGGNLQNNVILALAARLSREGYAVLRFNFRGVGRSQGSSSWSGKAERGDMIAAAAFLREQLTAKRASAELSADTSGSTRAPEQVFLVGYSYGSAIGMGCADLFNGCVAVSYPYGRIAGCFLGSHFSRVSAAPRVPKLFIIGDQDQFASAESVKGFAEKLENAQFFQINGVDHFWNGQEHELFAPIVGFLSSL